MIIGVDYSIKSPAVCVCGLGFFAIYFWSDRDYIDIKTGVINGVQTPIYLISRARTDSSGIKRYAELACWLEEIIASRYNGQSDLIVGFEGASFGSPGRVVQLAENIGAAKVAASRYTNKIFDIPPQTVKKFTTGHGRAEKDQMHDAFKEKTQVDLTKAGLGAVHGNPLSDIVDAFWIAQYILNNKDTLIQSLDSDGQKTKKKKKRRSKKAKSIDG